MSEGFVEFKCLTCGERLQYPDSYRHQVCLGALLLSLIVAAKLGLTGLGYLMFVAVFNIPAFFTVHLVNMQFMPPRFVRHEPIVMTLFRH